MTRGIIGLAPCLMLLYVLKGLLLDRRSQPQSGTLSDPWKMVRSLLRLFFYTIQFTFIPPATSHFLETVSHQAKFWNRGEFTSKQAAKDHFW